MERLSAMRWTVGVALEEALAQVRGLGYGQQSIFSES